MSKKLAVIGTAGRDGEDKILNNDYYEKMLDYTLEMIREFDVDTLISGGAAWADHLAVKMFLDGKISRLRLHLPTQFDMAACRFVEDRRNRYDPGVTANRYHRLMSENLGINSLNEIKRAIEWGASVKVTHGFKNRNLEVADEANYVLAFTFGTSNEKADVFNNEDAAESGLKDGGTAHTWNHSWKADMKRHINLGRFTFDRGMKP